MKHRSKRRFLLIIIGICLFLLTFMLTVVVLLPWLEQPTSPTFPALAAPQNTLSPTQPASLPTTHQPAIPVWNGGITTDSLGNLRFSATVSDLIRQYNLHHSPAMRPLEQWRQYPDSQIPCTQLRCTRYEFQLDPEFHSCPVIAVYAAERTQQILAVNLPLSQHDWSESLENFYRKQSIRILALFFPQRNQQQIEDLYNALFADAHDNVYISHSDSPAPKRIHTARSVGCYGYVYRGMICIQLIPVSADVLASFAAQGISIQTI